MVRLLNKKYNYLIIPAKHRYNIVELNDVLWRNFPKYGEFYFFFYIVYNQIYNHCYYPITMFYGELS